MIESEADLLVAMQGVAKSVSKALASGKAVVKALEKLDSPKSLERQDYLDDAISVLKTADLNSFGCNVQQKDIVKALEERLHKLRITAHQTLITGISKSVLNPQHLRVISDNPLVIYVHPLTLEVQFGQMKSTWTYAHEQLQTASLDPGEIMDAHKMLIETFRASRIDSQHFWECLKMAYDMVLMKNSEHAGACIDIVELLQPLAWLWPNQVAMKKSPANLPRYLLAYQLQKLRADGLLSHKGWRLELGTATGGSTRNKSNVLFVPMGASEGQYYLSLCFKQA
ncbi:MAG: hypothetical protein IJU23_13160 [Proteobacteria bacterium]|nr:hypothetical protein [Pseudomonadota bacterium]